MDLIRSAVAPDSWRGAAGTIGAISHLNGALVVTNTPKALSQVEALMESLRQVQTRRPASPRALARQADVKIKLVASMNNFKSRNWGWATTHSTNHLPRPKPRWASRTKTSHSQAKVAQSVTTRAKPTCRFCA